MTTLDFADNINNIINGNIKEDNCNPRAVGLNKKGGKHHEKGTLNHYVARRDF